VTPPFASKSPKRPNRPGRLRGALSIALSALILALFAALPAAPVLCEEGPPNPLCFEGPADYSYSSDRLWIHIQKRVITEPKLVTYFVCDVQTTDPNALKSAVAYDEQQTRKATSKIAERENAVLAINGDGYGFRGTGIVMRNSEIRRAKPIVGFHLLMADDKGDLSVAAQFEQKVNPERLTKDALAAGVCHIWSFGPELVRDGEAASFQGFDLLSRRTTSRAPRTAIGQMGPLHYVVVVVDGRRPEHSNGMSLPDLQQLFVDLGAQTAFNLDGGGSTTLYFCGEVINTPSDRRERNVSDIVYFN